MKEIVLNVQGMSCGHCVKAVEGALERHGAKGEVDLGANTVKVTYDESSVALEELKEAIEDQGYDIV